jgi:anaerobic C4-dicarboxylate transporter
MQAPVAAAIAAIAAVRAGGAEVWLIALAIVGVATRVIVRAPTAVGSVAPRVARKTPATVGAGAIALVALPVVPASTHRCVTESTMRRVE